ncbi:hypothetical protein [Crenalkalicoccus roseus]|uniref:hypothetical protein n=1 Tax=Crenalkalicoccus roseus TaxID=1485588 RepID=UPI00108103AA|nr:hypothetical protein [Crenalkalicoccus roseus]
MPRITLVLASGPGFPAGSAEHRYELEATLDAGGHLDAAAWQADPQPWPARRLRPGEAPREGDVQHDPETGWSLRFPPDEAGAELTEALLSPGVLRPGEYVTICTPGGVEYGYRVVSVA